MSVKRNSKAFLFVKVFNMKRATNKHHELFISRLNLYNLLLISFGKNILQPIINKRISIKGIDCSFDSQGVIQNERNHCLGSSVSFLGFGMDVLSLLECNGWACLLAIKGKEKILFKGVRVFTASKNHRVGMPKKTSVALRICPLYFFS
jgi:hypothetical protein